MSVRYLRASLAVGSALLLAACGSSSSSSSPSPGTSSPASASARTSTSSTAIGFEGMPIQQGAALAPASTTQTGTVDGISCAPVEQLAYHIHAHLSVFDNGTLRSLPGGVGIPGSVIEQTQAGPVALGGNCYYWLHTHAPDGVIHVESPTARIYTLGDFFDVWHQPLSPGQVASVKGKVTALVDGKPWTKDPRTIPLLPHAVIQLDVGSPAVTFRSVSWVGTQL